MNLKPFVEKTERLGLNIEGLIVFKGGEYASHRWTPELKRNVRSVSKSFVSIAVGMAIDEGKLKLCDRVSDAFKCPGGRRDLLTLEHLLTMNMGHTVLSRPRTLKEALSYELNREPGTCFFYDNACTFLASAMLTQASGLKLRDYLMDRLFLPLGISDPKWEESDDGYTIAARGLFLTTSEMSLFGRFLLQRGNWEGKQLVSSAWIDAATRTQVPTRPKESDPDNDLGYGYQFWICRHGAYRCGGKQGQYIVVLPALNAVVTIHSNEKKKPKSILWAIWNFILPQLKIAE